jgi:hypothetical protein
MIPLSALARAVLRHYAIRLALAALLSACVLALVNFPMPVMIALGLGVVLACVGALVACVFGGGSQPGAESDSRAPVVPERRRS